MRGLVAVQAWEWPALLPKSLSRTDLAKNLAAVSAFDEPMGPESGKNLIDRASRLGVDRRPAGR